MSKRKRDDDPAIVEVRERLARVETRLEDFEKHVDGIFEDLKNKIKSLDNRVWAILVTVVLSILLMIWSMVTPG